MSKYYYKDYIFLQDVIQNSKWLKRYIICILSHHHYNMQKNGMSALQNIFKYSYPAIHLIPVNVAAFQMAMTFGRIKSFSAMKHSPIVENKCFTFF